MQGQVDKPEEKVVSIFSARNAAKEKAQEAAPNAAAETTPKEQGESFADTMRKNAEVRERMRQERLKANQSVLKSYKIKN